jgi:fatty-acyl-CoA synthase
MNRDDFEHVADLLTRRAELTPDRVGLVELATGRQFTYAELNNRANQAANLLLQQYSILPGDRVSILANNNIAYLDLMFGLGKIGAIFAPLNWRLTAHELSYILNDSKPRLLFCGPEFQETLKQITFDSGPPELVSLEGTHIPDSLDYELTLAQQSTAEPHRPPLNGDSPFCILYTSGTTGRPKGAVIPHRQILWNAINTVISWGLSEQDISPVFTPMFHTGGLFVFLMPLIYAGGKVLLARSFNPEESLQVIEKERCTVILGVPTIFQVWQQEPYFSKVDFSHVRFFINGGASCPLPIMDHWRKTKNVVFRQGYGLTEVGPNCFSMTNEESLLKPGSVGKPIFHSKMRLVDPFSGQDVPPDEPGELLIAGPHVCAGYWQNEAASTESIVDGWFHTGDTARRDPDGFYYIIGRYKDMIKSGGENIYAAEVEAVFRDHPHVADAALIGVPDDKWGEVGAMIVVLHPGYETTAQELIHFCSNRLARYKIPKYIWFADTLPYSPYGKIEKNRLKEIYLPKMITKESDTA